MTFRGFFGPPNVKELFRKRDVSGLINALGYTKDDSIRRDAARALVSLGNIAVKPLGEALTSKDTPSAVCKTIILILDKVGGEQVVPGLMGALENDHPEVANAAAMTLSRIGAPAIKPLLGALKSPNETARRAAIMALKKLPDPRMVKPLMTLAHQAGDGDIAEACAQVLSVLGDATLEALIPYLQEHIDHPPHWPLTALAENQGQQAVSLLIELLSDEQQVQDIRHKAAEILGKRKERKAVEPLIAVLNDTTLDWHVRGAAAKALGEIGDRRALGALQRALNDRYTTGRTVAAEAIRQIESAPPPDTLDPLVVYHEGSWWGNLPEPYEAITGLAVIGSRVGERVDSNEITQAIKAGYISPDAFIYLCATLPSQLSDEELENVMVETAQLVAADCDIDWENSDWGVALIDTHIQGHHAVVISKA
jgi:HEAT repeat protein